MTIGQAKLDPMQRLAAAIIMQAALDARAGDIGALAWLKSDQALELVDFIGMDWLIVQRWTQRTGEPNKPAAAGCIQTNYTR